MQHLRSTGAGVDAIFVEAPKKRQQKRGEFKLPQEVLPAQEADERDYHELVGIPERPFGLQPDMDPRLREALEALEDEAYETFAEGEEGDDFFGAVVDDKEGGDDDQWEDEEEEETAGAYEIEVERFKAKRPPSDIDSDDDLDSEAGDTIAELRASAARRPPRPPASAMSGMSAASMARSEGLQNLDDQFDKIEAEYEDEEDSSYDEDEPDEQDFTLFDPTVKRDDFDGMLDDFLARFEIVGNKLKHKLEGETPQAKVDTIRRELLGQEEGTVSDALAHEQKARIKEMAEAIQRRQAKRVDKPDLVRDERYSDKYDRWDCDTILSAPSSCSALRCAVVC